MGSSGDERDTEGVGGEVTFGVDALAVLDEFPGAVKVVDSEKLACMDTNRGATALGVRWREGRC